MPDQDTAQDKLKALLGGQYTGAVRFRASAATYLSYTLTLHTSADAWMIKKNPTLGWYWIFRTDGSQCLQDDRNQYFVMHFWNADGHAQWPPQDWETFKIESAEDGTRIVLKSQNDGYVAPGSFSQNNGSPHLYCDHPKNSGTRFEVEFL